MGINTGKFQNIGSSYEDGSNAAILTAIARSIAELIRETIANTRFEMNGRKYSMTISAGIATNEGQLTTPARITEAADVALYEAKQRGRNMVISLSGCSFEGR